MHFASRKPGKCPTCGEKPVASILWGMPNMTPELEAKLIKGTWTLGGCCVVIPSAMWRCNACGADIYHERDRSQLETNG
jgi:hypothetical protein